MTGLRFFFFTVVCCQRKLTTQPVLFQSLLILWFYDVPSAPAANSRGVSCFTRGVILTVGHRLSLSLRAGSRHIVANTFIWVISPSIVPRANQIITKAPNFDLRLRRCNLRVHPLICLAFWHKVFESGEIRILLGSVIDWKSISQSAAEADKSNKLFPALFCSVSPLLLQIN